MKNYSLNPTDENVVEMFKNDVIGRNREISRFMDLLATFDSNCSIALNSGWDNGKTFFVKQIKLILDYYNPHSGMSLEERESAWQAIHALDTQTTIISSKTQRRNHG